MMTSTPLLGQRSAMMTPRSAVSRWTERSRSEESRRYPRRCFVAKGAYLTCVVRIMCGEKGVDLGSARGPWTVQLSLSPDDPATVPESDSRYADPDAEG